MLARRAFAGRDERHKGSPVVPDGQHAEDKRYQHRYEGDRKEGAAFRHHRNEGVDGAREHRRRDKLLRRPHDFWGHPGEQVDEHPARRGGDQPDDDRGKDPKP